VTAIFESREDRHVHPQRHDPNVVFSDKPSLSNVLESQAMIDDVSLMIQGRDRLWARMTLSGA